MSVKEKGRPSAPILQKPAIAGIISCLFFETCCLKFSLCSPKYAAGRIAQRISLPTLAVRGGTRAAFEVKEQLESFLHGCGKNLGREEITGHPLVDLSQRGIGMNGRRQSGEFDAAVQGGHPRGDQISGPGAQDLYTQWFFAFVQDQFDAPLALPFDQARSLAAKGSLKTMGSRPAASALRAFMPILASSGSV